MDRGHIFYVSAIASVVSVTFVVVVEVHGAVMVLVNSSRCRSRDTIEEEVIDSVVGDHVCRGFIFVHFMLFFANLVGLDNVIMGVCIPYIVYKGFPTAFEVVVV